jgi:hypothetical protein
VPARIAEEFQALVADYVERRFGGQRKSAWALAPHRKIR